MSREKEKLARVVDLVDKVSVDPNVEVDYFIPGVLVTVKDGGERSSGGPYIRFTYAMSEGMDPHVQRVPLTHGYLDKEPQDLANMVTSYLERFMEEMDSRQYGAQ